MCIGMANGGKQGMTDRYKEAIQGARDCVERNKDGSVYLPDLLVVIDRQQAVIEKRESQCDEFEKLVKKALTCCDDKDAQIDRLFEVVEDWKKAYEGARRLACEEIKLIPGLITRKKIDRFLKEKGW